MCEQKTTQADEWMKQVREINSRKKKSRMDIIGQNGNDGEHYYEHPEPVKDNNKNG